MGTVVGKAGWGDHPDSHGMLVTHMESVFYRQTHHSLKQQLSLSGRALLSNSQPVGVFDLFPNFPILSLDSFS